MPGLILVAGGGAGATEHADGFERVLAAERALDMRAELAHRDALCRVGRSVAHPLGHAEHASADGVRVWVYGSIYPRFADRHAEDNALESPAERVARLYARYGKTVVEHLNGEFNVVIRDAPAGRLLAFNDRFGIRPWYVVEAGGQLALAPSARAAAAFAPGGATLDREMAASFLVFNKMRLGDRTLMRGVTVLPAATRLCWTDGEAGPRRETYWGLRYNDEVSDAPIADDTVERLVALYREAMRRRVDPAFAHRFGLALSGGLDSRTMAGALPADRVPRVMAHTYGLPESDEVRLAARVAEAVGLPQRIWPLAAADYVAAAGEGMRRNVELDLFVQGAQCRWMAAARDDLDVLMTGIDLDVTLGGIYMDADVMQAASDDDLLALLLRKNTVFRPEEARALFGETLRDETRAFAADTAAELLKDLPQQHPAARYDLFIHRHSMRRVIMMRYALIRQYFETASPVYDYDFIERVAELPVNHRAGHRAFVPFLLRLAPALAEIPYQRTTLPATAPLEFWRRAAELENAREQLYRELWAATAGRVFVPYRRYYTNFDEWLRLDPAWRTLTDELLAAPDARLYDTGLARPEAVHALVDEHRRGGNRRQPLICLMSAELYLRTEFA